MNVEHLLNMTCTITRVADTGAADVYGNPTEDTSTARTTCWVERRPAGREMTGEADWQMDSADLYLPPDVVLTGNDRVTIAGVAWEVVGPPWTHTHPATGDAVYVAATIRRAQ